MTKKNDIIIVTECPYSGVLRAIIEDVKIFKSLGYTVTFIVPKKFRDRYDESGIKNVSQLKEFGIVDYLNLRRKLRYLISDALGVFRYLKNKKNYILFSYSGYAGKISRILYAFDKNKRVIHVPQCMDFIRKNGIQKIIDFLFEKVLAKQSAGYLACGSSEMESLVNTYHIPLKKVHLNPNSIKNNYSKQLSPTKNTFRFEFVILGRVVKDKGVHKLLKVLKSLNLLNKTIIIGGGNLLDKLRCNYREAIFIGNISNEQVYEYLSGAKFVLSASIIEGLPFSILEAMSLGTVPIVSKVKGHKDIVTHGITGFLFSNEAELYDIIFQSQLLPRDTYQKISQNAAKCIRLLYKFKLHNLRKFFSLYE